MIIHHSNKILRHREEISKYHYVRKADPDSEYWFDFAESIIENYQELFADNYCLVIAGNPNIPDDFYAIPFDKVKELFISEHLSNDAKGRVRWIGRIENHLLKVSNSGKAVNIKRFYGNWSNIDWENIIEANSDIATELNRRKELFAKLLNLGGPFSVATESIRNLRMYGGAQGIWVDQEYTLLVDPNRIGLTVSVLHKGERYQDDLHEDGIIYHYPSTRRPERRDRNEINATKNLRNYNLPLFVISVSKSNTKLRDVQVGWVDDWDDKSKTFLIKFRGIDNSLPAIFEEEQPFKLTDNKKGKKRLASTRPGQTDFRFKVIKRYGPSCGVCSMDLLPVLDAAHLKPKELNGSDDPRNGLVLCATHHRAFENGLFGIIPNTFRLIFRKEGPSKEDLHIENTSIEHLLKKPHVEALNWAHKNWNKLLKADS